MLDFYKNYYKTYINDIIIYSDFFEKYIDYLKTVFSFFVNKNIVISPKKSFISYLNVKVFGFYVDFLKFTITENRVKAIYDFEFFKTLKAFKTYINIISFF